MGSRAADETAATGGARPDDGGQDDSGSEVDAWASSEDEEGLDPGAREGPLRDRPKTVHGKGKRGAVRGAARRAVEAACSRDRATHFFNRRAAVLCERVATFGEKKGQAVQCLLVLKKHWLVSPENRVAHRRAMDEADSVGTDNRCVVVLSNGRQPMDADVISDVLSGNNCIEVSKTDWATKDSWSSCVQKHAEMGLSQKEEKAARTLFERAHDLVVGASPPSETTASWGVSVLVAVRKEYMDGRPSKVICHLQDRNQQGFLELDEKVRLASGTWLSDAMLGRLCAEPHPLATVLSSEEEVQRWRGTLDAPHLRPPPLPQSITRAMDNVCRRNHGDGQGLAAWVARGGGSATPTSTSEQCSQGSAAISHDSLWDGASLAKSTPESAWSRSSAATMESNDSPVPGQGSDDRACRLDHVEEKGETQDMAETDGDVSRQLSTENELSVNVTNLQDVSMVDQTKDGPCEEGNVLDMWEENDEMEEDD